MIPEPSKVSFQNLFYSAAFSLFIDRIPDGSIIILIYFVMEFIF